MGLYKSKDLQKSRIKYEKDMVSKCRDLLKQRPPMFHNSTCIVLLSSGVNASAEVKNQLQSRFEQIISNDQSGSVTEK